MTALINLLNALAIDFECDDNIYAKETCDKAAAALRTLLESNAALERERDELKHDIARYVAIASEEATRAEAAEARVKEDHRILRSSIPEEFKSAASPVGAVQSYIATLEERLAEAMKVIEPFARDAKNAKALSAHNSIAYVTTLRARHLRAAERFMKENGNGE